VETSVHGTCVALGSFCAVLRGPSGAGKSDLALRFLFLSSELLGSSHPALIADDQVTVRRAGGTILASCPPALAGLIEVRGLGIMRVSSTAKEAELKLLVDLDRTADLPRFPFEKEWEQLFDLPVRRVVLDPQEASAPIKLALMLQNFFGEAVDYKG
jgi:HPr kinase/phosphorylase